MGAYTMGHKRHISAGSEIYEIILPVFGAAGDPVVLAGLYCHDMHGVQKVHVRDHILHPGSRQQLLQLGSIGYSFISASGEVLDTGIWSWPNKTPAPELLGIRSSIREEIDKEKQKLQQMLDALEWGARMVPEESGAFLQVSGLSYEIHTGIPTPCWKDEKGMCIGIEGERRVKNVMFGDEPLDPDRRYTVSGQEYLLLEQGDGFTMFEGAAVLKNQVKLDSQLLTDHLADALGGRIGTEFADPAGQGRIVISE